MMADPKRSGEVVIPYLADGTAFFTESCDIYVCTVSPTAIGPDTIRDTVSCLFTGSPLEGYRSKVANALAYTHLAVLDHNVQVIDSYKGQGVAVNDRPDFFAVTSAQTSNYYRAVLSFVTIIPGMGKKKVVLLDRWSTPGDWTTVL